MREFVAVAIPDIDLFAEPVEERAVAVVEMQDAGAVFAPGAVLDFAAEVMRHELHPVADAEDRHAERKDRRVGLRRVLSVDARRPAAEDDAVGVQSFAISVAGVSKREDLANRPGTRARAAR